MEDNNSFKNVSSFHDGRLGHANNMVRHRIDAICGHLGKDFKADIKEKKISKLLYMISF